MEYRSTEESFDAEVHGSDTPVLVDCYADWCGPCKMMMPVVEKMAETYEGKVKVGKLNVDENNAIAAKYGVMSIPSFIVFKNGEVLNSSTGAMSQANLAKMLDDAL